MRCLIIILTCLGFVIIGNNEVFAQEDSHRFYVRSSSKNFTPELFNNNGRVFSSSNSKLKNLLVQHEVYKFERAFPSSQKPELQRTWYVETSSRNFGSEILRQMGNDFVFQEYVGNTPITLASALPNDYGQTNPDINTGLFIKNSYLDFVNAGDAWTITTGNSNIIIGISDSRVLDTDIDFTGKINVLNNSQTPDSHGTTVAAIAAAKGNNSNGTVGICYDCDIVSTNNNYNTLIDLAINGAKIINCSWGTPNNGIASESERLAIEEVYDMGVIVVAAAHNQPWGNSPTEQGHFGNVFYYPASYKHVISVSSVSHRHETISDSLFNTSIGWKASNIKDHVSRMVLFGPNEPDENTPYSAELGTTNVLNTSVDILAPGGEIFSYGSLRLNNEWKYTYMATSPATPQVSGTLGLMFSINECLTFEQAESILKIGSRNIDHIQANQFAAGKYGSGSLNTGKAVKLVNDLLNPTEIAYLSDQKFTRWDFEFEGVSQHIEIRNQEFTEASTLNVVAKNGILIEENSLLEPNSDGDILLDIDPSLVIATDCVSTRRIARTSEREEYSDESKESKYIIAPTLVDNEMSITERFKGNNDLISIQILDLMNRDVYSRKGLVFNTRKELTFNLQSLIRGIYIVKGYSSTGEVVLTEKIIKL